MAHLDGGFVNFRRGRGERLPEAEVSTIPGNKLKTTVVAVLASTVLVSLGIKALENVQSDPQPSDTERSVYYGGL